MADAEITAPEPQPAPTAFGRAVSRMLLMVVVGVVGLAATAVVCFGWGIVKTYDFTRLLFEDGAGSDLALVYVLEIIDTFLLATVLLILAVGLYDLFIDGLPTPEWLIFKDLTSLKAKVSDVIVLLLAIKFLEKTNSVGDPLDLVWYATSIVLVGGLLIAFRSAKSK